MFCSSCGTQADSLAQQCNNCGTALGAPAAATTATATSSMAGAPAASGPAAGAAGAGMFVATAYPLAVQPPRMIVVRSGKSAGLAAVLSFLWCGLGQIYNGEIAKGVLFMILYVISFLLIFVVIGVFTTLALWIWGMVDAYRTAERLHQQAGLA